MTNSSHINVRNLSVFYNNTPALENISVTVPDKKITVIIGPSGCGKSTLLRSFNRLLETDAGVRLTGEVFVDTEDIYRPGVEPTHIRRKTWPV